MSLALFLACLAVVLGPLLYIFFYKSKATQRIIDGFVFVSISGLLLIHFLQDFHQVQDWIALGCLILGFYGPLLLERAFVKIRKEVHTLTLIAGIIGFLVHEALDGAALIQQDSAGLQLTALSAAIIIHRIPVGLTLWWLLAPRYGKTIAITGIIFSLLFTIAGYNFAHEISLESFHQSFSWLQAFVAGSILHVVIFRFHLHEGADKEGGSCCDHEEVEDRKTFLGLGSPDRLLSISYEGIGNLLGLLLVIYLTVMSSGLHIQEHSDRAIHGHAHHTHHEIVSTVDKDNKNDFSLPNIANNFLVLSLESAPALLLAYLLGILIYGFFPEGSVRWLSKGGATKQAAKGMVVGLPLPICSCGVLPYYQTLVKKGVPPAAAVAFLIATPELGIDALLISLPLLGGDLTLIRLIASALIAFIVALLVAPLIKPRRSLNVISDQVGLSVKDKINKGYRFALIELVDTTAPWMFVGLLLASVAAPLMSYISWSVNPMLEVFIFSSLGLIVYVCASGATPLVAALVAAGVSPGAGLAFLITGPATNITTFGVLSELHGKLVAFKFAILMIIAAVITGILTNLILSDYIAPLADLSAHSDHNHFKTINIIALSGIAILFTLSLLRQGARKFFGHVLGS